MTKKTQILVCRNGETGEMVAVTNPKFYMVAKTVLKITVKAR